MELSRADIERASFDVIGDGGWDPSQVRAFLEAVAVRVGDLEQLAADAGAMRAAALELVDQAESLVEQAKARSEPADETAAGERFDAYAAATGELAALRREAESALEMAYVDAARLVARAEEDAERIESATRRRLNETEAQSEVDRIVAEAEFLLEEARAESQRILKEARLHADDLRTRHELSGEIHRSIAALRAVTDVRVAPRPLNPVAAVRGRAASMLAELRRTEGRLDPEVRADFLDQLFEVQDVVKRIEARLMGHEEEDSSEDGVFLDLTDSAAPFDVESTVRPSRYQQRSANLPKIGRDVEDVSRAVRSIREHLDHSD